MFLEECEVIENLKISEDKYLLRVKSKEAFKYTKAGQFFMLKSETYLRRPISAHYAREDILEFYYQVKGEGTFRLSKLKKSDFLNAQGPLGNGFDVGIENKKLLIAAGGMGIAPIKLLNKHLKEKNDVTLVFGGADESAVRIINLFDLKKIKLYITTDDGSVGDKSDVVRKTKELLKKERYDLIYTCGPSSMMGGIIKSASINDIECHASLEKRMACGVNVCLGCSIETKGGKNEIVLKKVCHDGPVFNARILNGIL